MERTKLREDYRAEWARNPWLAAVHAHAQHMWAEGYRQALRDLADENLLDRDIYYDRTTPGAIEDSAVEWLTEREERVKHLVALADIGPLISTP